MNQQINLYQPIFRKQKAIFSALAMLQVWGIIVLVMGAISAYTAFNLGRLEGQLADALSYQNRTRTSVEELKEKQLAQTPSKLLEAELLRTRMELAERQAVVRLLAEGAFSNTGGFSAQMEDLSRHHAAGTWLTGFSIRQGGTWVNLRGIALSPEIVPAYLQGLLSARSFAATKFNVMNLQSLVDTPERVSFEAGTAGASAEPSASGSATPVTRQLYQRGEDELVAGNPAHTY